MLKIVKNERVIMTDIDDTLIIHGPEDVAGATYVNVADPIYEGDFIRLQVNEPMVRLVREEIARGSQICYWSRGGYQWAVNVLQALDLDTYESEQLVLTKPYAYFDDKDVSEWLTDRVYIGPNVSYKSNRIIND